MPDPSDPRLVLATAVDQRVFTSYIWVIFPDQPEAGRSMESTEVKAENQATNPSERVSERLHREGQLAAVHSALAIQQQLTGPLRALWDRGYVSVGELWDLYSTCPGSAIGRSSKMLSARS